MTPVRTLHKARLRVARRESLSFPEPFFWTTNDIERLGRLDSNYRSHLHARALDALNALPTKIRIAAEGDSWFDHPCIPDVMDWFDKFGYAPYRSDTPGRKLATMLREKVYLGFLDDPTVKAVLLSGGGNDLISWKRTSQKQPSRIFKAGGGSANPADYLNDSELSEALAALEGLLAEFARDVQKKRPGLRIITHCYDRFKPRTSGPFGAWIGPQMDLIGVPKSGPLRNKIAALLIDRANDAYRHACAAHQMTFVDLRGTTGDRWYDEIHPNELAFHDIAKKLADQIPAARGSIRRHGVSRRYRPPSAKEGKPSR
jgi:hypothetical protein